MTAPHGHPRTGHPDDNFSEFAEELRLLAEAVLERVEPVLRRTAADGRTQWSSCAWCPVCAAAAVVRGEHHDVVAAIADHGTAIVTVLREALAGVPVEPVVPPDLDPESPEFQAWLHDSFGHGGYDDPAANRDPAAMGDPTQDDAAATKPGAAHGAREAGTHTRSSAALAALIARFAAGAQGIRTERDTPNDGGAARDGVPEGGADSGYRAPGSSGNEAGRRARGDASSAGAQSGVAASARSDAAAAGRSGGETSGGGTASDSAGAQGDRARSDPESGDPLGRGPGAARRPGDKSPEHGGDLAPGSGGRGATRAGYVPIDVTIKA